jgi:hypothetical protein
VLWDHDDDFHSVFDTLGVVSFHLLFLDKAGGISINIGVGGKRKIHTKRAWMCLLLLLLHMLWCFLPFYGLCF